MPTNNSWNSPLPVPPISGGTGTSDAAYTAHALFVGDVGGGFAQLGAATNGQIPIGSAGADPVLANITSTDLSVTVTNGAGTIDLSVPAAGGLSLGAFGSTPNADGLTLSAGVLNMQPCDGTHPGGISTGSQTIAGAKTFSSAPNLSSLTASTAVVLDGSKNCASLAYDATGTASVLVSRDSNGNSVATNWVNKSTSVTSAGGTTVLTAASTRTQVLQGTQNQTFQLPDATTLSIGAQYNFNNNSTGSLSVVNAASGAIITVPSGGSAYVIAIAVSTSAGAWDSHILGPSAASWGTAGLTTNSVTTPQVLLTGSSSGTISILPQAAAGTFNFNLPVTAGTSGYVLTSAGGGSSPMTWTNPTSIGATTMNADSGSAVASGGAWTVTGGSTGLTTLGSGASLSITGTLGVANGGTGATTLTGVLTGNGTGAVTANAVTQNGVLIAGASNAVSSLAVASDGTVLTGNTGAAPSFQSVGAKSGLTAHGVVIAEGSSAFAATAAGSAGQVLQSGGASADPTWSTATYPASTTASQLLYSSSNNVVAGLTTGNNGVLITSAGGVPSISSTLPSAVQGNITSVGTIASGTWQGTAVDATHGGTAQTTWTTGDLLYASASNTLSKLAIGSSNNVLTVSGGVPSWQAAPAGGLTWATSTTSQTAAVNNGYLDTDTSGTDTYTLPATAAVGDTISVARTGAGGVVVAANTGQTIRFGSTATSSAGSLTSQAQGDAVTVVCYAANTSWIVVNSQGNWTAA